jgi:putative two-component system response regulator
MSRKDKETILVVDDDPFVLESLSGILNECGYRVFASGTAGEAIVQLHGNSIDVVLTDIMMPDVSGIQLLEKIHNHDKDIPVILMTGYAELDTAIVAIKKGAVDFITKPFLMEYLVSVVAKDASMGHRLKRATSIYLRRP